MGGLSLLFSIRRLQQARAAAIGVTMRTLLLAIFDIAPILALVGVCRAENVRWWVAILLLVGSALLACPLMVLGDLTIFPDVKLHTFHDSLTLNAGVFLLCFVVGVYPRGAWLAIAAILAWRTWDRTRAGSPAHQRIVFGISSGLLAGGLIAVCTFLIYQTPLADIGNSSEFTERFHPPPLFVQISLLTGAIDGFFLALFRARKACDGAPAQEYSQSQSLAESGR